MVKLIYLHGFLSSPGSIKARQLLTYIAQLRNPPEIYLPALADYPQQALAKIEQLIHAIGTDQLCLIGSSLGGYYAAWLAEKYATKAVLINPAIKPFADLRAYLGIQRNIYTQDSYRITEQHLDELRAIKVSILTRPERYFLLVQTGDELLDYREAVQFYHGAQQVVIEGGDHGFQRFTDHIPQILKFAGIQL